MTANIQKNKVLAVVGPTASGKTSLSIALAHKFNGEVISADSRQIYRGLDIGTGKATAEEQQGVPHHLLDIRDIGEKYNAAEFSRDADKIITDIVNRNKLPIVAGGTFFYLDNLRGRSITAPVPPNPELRAKLETFSTEQLFAKLQNKDPEYSQKIDRHNKRKLIRALEIVKELGKVPPPQIKPSPYAWLIIGLEVDKDKLLENFARRLDEWLERGFVDEVRGLLAAGLTQDELRELGFEYTLMTEYLNGNVTLSELKEKFIQKNWQYAKRQMTWLKQDQEIKWFKPEDREAVFRLVTDFLHP